MNSKTNFLKNPLPNTLSKCRFLKYHTHSAKNSQFEIIYINIIFKKRIPFSLSINSLSPLVSTTFLIKPFIAHVCKASEVLWMSSEEGRIGWGFDSWLIHISLIKIRYIVSFLYHWPNFGCDLLLIELLPVHILKEGVFLNLFSSFATQSLFRIFR